MSLIKSKQIDLSDLSVALANYILITPTVFNLWRQVFNSTYTSAVFSQALGNLTAGQSNLVVNLGGIVPDVILVYRNGGKLVKTTDYSIDLNTTPGSMIITLVSPAAATTGAAFSEMIEINYY